MNPLVIEFASGRSFFYGMFIVVIACLLQLPSKTQITRAILSVLAITGAVLVAFSATPMSLSLYILWSLLVIMELVMSEKRKTDVGKYRRVVLVFLTAISMLMFLLELPQHLTPGIPAPGNRTIYVVGDSISSGIGPDIKVWPDVLRDEYKLKVENLAQPGATVKTAIPQAQDIKDKNAFVLLEIGGNDLLGNDPDIKAFESSLNELLTTVSEPERIVVMFELPLIPFSNRFGLIQRELAKSHGVILIPKRYMAKVFGAPDSTLDGLHLSESGHKLMAATIWTLLTPEK